MKELCVPLEDFVSAVWDGMMHGMDMSIKADQLELVAPREV